MQEKREKVEEEIIEVLNKYNLSLYESEIVFQEVSERLNTLSRLTPINRFQLPEKG